MNINVSVDVNTYIYICILQQIIQLSLFHYWLDMVNSIQFRYLNQLKELLDSQHHEQKQRHHLHQTKLQHELQSNYMNFKTKSFREQSNKNKNKISIVLKRKKQYQLPGSSKVLSCQCICWPVVSECSILRTASIYSHMLEDQQTTFKSTQNKKSKQFI